MPLLSAVERAPERSWPRPVATAVSVEVNEPIGGTWDMLRSSHKWTKAAAWASQFTVPVAADGAAVLKYRVRVTY